MARRLYATIGRAPDNDVVLDHPTVSNHHARLSWKGAALLVEDLSSANGTYVDGERVKSAQTRPGAGVRVGELELPWSHAGLRALLKAGAGQRTQLMPTGTGRAGDAAPAVRASPSSNAGLWSVLALSFLGLAAAGYFYYRRPSGASLTPSKDDGLAVLPVVNEQLAALRIGGANAQKLAAALDPMDPVTRNTAVKLAARTEGPFHVEQVAEVWAGVRKQWRYVNDPEGREYFATASESIGNGYIGDCDDFAVTLASMVIAIGGKARVVLMDGPQGGHAYAEACVQGEPPKVATALTKHYRNQFRRYITGGVPKTISYRSSPECPIWLNLDWSASVPGGPYEAEQWAVAVYEGGRTETLSPAAASAPSKQKD